MPGSIKFSFEGFGFTQVERSFRTKGQHAEDISPALRVVNDQITGILKEQFDTEGAAGGARWQDLAESTVAYKRAHDLRPEILRATDRLMKSLTEPGDEDALLIIEPAWLVRGSKVEYGPYHQRGNPNLPQRKIFNFTSLHRRDIVKTIQRWLMTGAV